jgi:hypothetical protein
MGKVWETLSPAPLVTVTVTVGVTPGARQDRDVHVTSLRPAASTEVLTVPAVVDQAKDRDSPELAETVTPSRMGSPGPTEAGDREVSWTTGGTE